jgi:AcrR family transcriptional regulator
MTQRFASTEGSTTRTAILDAMIQLASMRRVSAIRIADIVALAEIGRSTFYEHFACKDDVLLAVLDPILLHLANAASNRAAHPILLNTMRHIWDRRQLFRAMLASPVSPKLQRKLAGLILERRQRRYPDETNLHAAATASGQLLMLAMWTGGEVSLPVKEFAAQFLAFSKLR